MKSAKQYRQQLKENGVFYTSIELANKLKSFLPTGINEIYDPTCGSGNLLSVFGDEVKKYGQEIDEDTTKEAQINLVNADIRAGDTLLNDRFESKKFKYIVANPPFSVKWQPMLLQNDERFINKPLPPQGRADFAFIYHILHHLTDDGKALVLNACGVLNRGNSEQKCRKFLIENNYIDYVILIPSGHFEDTKVTTALLILRKNRGDNDKVFFEDWQQNRTIQVSLEEIKNNNYDLSVNLYLPIEREEKPVEPFEKVAERVKSGMVQQLKSYLELLLKLPLMGDIRTELDQLQKVIDEYRLKIGVG